jgi:UDP-glucose 4-epimerase
LLKLIKPSFHKRLYESLEVNNQSSKTKLNFKNIYTTEEGIQHMIYGKDT